MKTCHYCGRHGNLTRIAPLVTPNGDRIEYLYHCDGGCPEQRYESTWKDWFKTSGKELELPLIIVGIILIFAVQVILTPPLAHAVERGLISVQGAQRGLFGLSIIVGCAAPAVVGFLGGGGGILASIVLFVVSFVSFL